MYTRSRNNATLYALNYQSQNALGRILRNKSIREEINAFYSRQLDGMPPIPNYLANSVYSQLVEKQHLIFTQIRDPDRSNKNEQDSVQEDEEEEDDWESLLVTGSLFKLSPDLTKATPSAKEFEAFQSLLTTDLFKMQLMTQDLRLPTEWDTAAKGENIDISINRLQLTYKGNERDEDVSSARANHSIKKQCGIYYFEVQILSRSEDAEMSIGLCIKIHSLNRFPGSEDFSWGYHGEDGNVYSGPGTEKPFGPKYGSGDVIGCGVDFRDMSLFYTKNGVFLGTAFQKMKASDLFPCVGFKASGEKIEANFGSRPFYFDIRQYLNTKKCDLLNSISLIPKPSSRFSTINDYVASNICDDVVLEYLRHYGYDSAAKSLENNLHAKGSHVRKDTTEDPDLIYRKEIHRAVLNGNISKVFKLCKKHYPDVLENNPLVVLKLKCREFMEMVRQVQHTSVYTNAEHEMQSLEISENTGLSKRSVRTISSKDTNNRKKKLKLSKQKPSAFNDIIQYGHELKALYEEQSRTDETVKQELMAAFSTMAYTDLKDPEIAYLYEPAKLESVASELNSAILVSLGKPSDSCLECIYRQTNAVVDELVLMGDAKAALLQPEQDSFK